MSANICNRPGGCHTNDLIKVHFFEVPLKTKWVKANGEVILFNEAVKLLPTNKQVMVDAMVAAQIMTSVSATNIYKLYVNNKVVSEGSFSAINNQITTSTIPWGGMISSGCNCNFIQVRVKLTVQLTGGNASSSSNIQNLLGSPGGKGSTLRVLVF